ncbi:hypothetical protein CONLIGDRAFT_636289 [Coniochaeta ligniaria NRRL 30616]|uniref:Uncharacterized protein n=1 Tax=Coniochaeta ligniaria NRRL 30616 TaxID=1408157 RepID=A0A1J7J5X7_9PEZI|nr:hypothetical protein CONLIGDRAFT_636289 [Coniochaeta ligniaria NRRL 30616]
MSYGVVVAMRSVYKLKRLNLNLVLTPTYFSRQRNGRARSCSEHGSKGKPARYVFIIPDTGFGSLSSFSSTRSMCSE